MDRSRTISYVGVLATVLFTVAGQLLLKYRVEYFGALPDTQAARIRYLAKALLDPLVIASLAFAGLAFFSWIIALTNLDLSRAYPFTALNYVFVIVLSAWFLGEPLTLNKIVGVSFVIAGIVVASRGS